MSANHTHITAKIAFHKTHDISCQIGLIYHMTELYQKGVIMSASFRPHLLENLAKTEFDLLIIGGGATGCGIAFDAATRGLKIALIEANDFASGTSSKSTKLLHGGMRYLEKAIVSFDLQQLLFVKSALNERFLALQNAPHLASKINIAVPLYSYSDLVYYWTGALAYEWLSGKSSLGPCGYWQKNTCLKHFSCLKKEGLKGAIHFFDGQFDDARMALCLALSAQDKGAQCANYIKVLGLEKKNGKTVGAHCEDVLTKERISIHAKTVINALGPNVDWLRQLDDPNTKAILKPSRGTHIVLDGRLLPNNCGLLLPKTKDKRLLFLLPYKDSTLVGTTDVEVADMDFWNPQPSTEEIAYLLEHVGEHLEVKPCKTDIVASWAGLRPLLRADHSTANLSREHLVEKSASGLVTVAGGKWTSYRKMAQDAVDTLTLTLCKTHKLPLRGSEADVFAAKTELIEMGLSKELAGYLSRRYGTHSYLVAKLARQGFDHPLSKKHPFIAAEVVFAAQFEMACTADDVLFRRLGLGFIDEKEAARLRPEIEKIMNTMALRSF